MPKSNAKCGIKSGILKEGRKHPAIAMLIPTDGRAKQL